MPNKGMLYLVSTPIGNLEDMTLRAIRILKEVDLIAAEDTRKTLKLLNHFEISKPLTSFFRHNESQKGQYIVDKLLAGQNIALVSDAGTPAISDPGEELVKKAIENDITICPIPGAVAAISGLICSGLPTDRFVFEGFIPTNKHTRKEKLEGLVNETRTIIFYEAPHKLITTLKDIFKFFGNRKIVLAREITKIHEEIVRSDLETLLKIFEEKSPRGEYVLILEGSEKQIKSETSTFDNISIDEHMSLYIKQGIDSKEAMKKVALDRGVSKRDVYNYLLKK